jgi:CPA1 family monovalent cation:H+ antiporter
MESLHFAVTTLMVLLLIASAVAMATKWVRVPYTLALVIVGLVISPMHFLPEVHISPELILLIFLPALLFDAAWNLRLDQLRLSALPILTLAVLGVCVSTAVVGLLLCIFVGMPWSLALLFGAMISATDPVSVLALFKSCGLPKQLATLIEGESLFNDGTALFFVSSWGSWSGPRSHRPRACYGIPSWSSRWSSWGASRSGPWSDSRAPP